MGVLKRDPNRPKPKPFDPNAPFFIKRKSKLTPAATAEAASAATDDDPGAGATEEKATAEPTDREPTRSTSMRPVPLAKGKKTRLSVDLDQYTHWQFRMYCTHRRRTAHDVIVEVIKDLLSNDQPRI